MRLDLALMIEAAAMVEVVDPGEEESEGIRSLGCCEDSLEESGLI